MRVAVENRAVDQFQGAAVEEEDAAEAGTPTPAAGALSAVGAVAASRPGGVDAQAPHREPAAVDARQASDPARDAEPEGRSPGADELDRRGDVRQRTCEEDEEVAGEGREVDAVGTGTGLPEVGHGVGLRCDHCFAQGHLAVSGDGGVAAVVHRQHRGGGRSGAGEPTCCAEEENTRRVADAEGHRERPLSRRR
jgi:hypothetical protein